MRTIYAQVNYFSNYLFARWLQSAVSNVSKYQFTFRESLSTRDISVLLYELEYEKFLVKVSSVIKLRT